MIKQKIGMFYKNYRKIIFLFLVVGAFASAVVIILLNDKDEAKFWFEMLYFYSGILLILGVVLAFESFVDDHEYKRRACFIELMRNWNATNQNGHGFIVRKLIKELNKAQRKQIINYEEIDVNDEVLQYVKLCVCHNVKCEHCCEKCNVIYIKKDSKTILTKQSVVILRQRVVTYLNEMECICSAAVNNVADFDMVREQFFYIADFKENYLSMLSDFEVLENFPCTKKFIERVTCESYKGKRITG